MKFKQYLDKVLDKTAFIDEFCNDRHQCTHTAFGLGEKVTFDDGEIDDNRNYLMLYGDGNGDVDTTKIDIQQEVIFDGDGLWVEDTHNNRISLVFYQAEIIPHPTLDNEPKSV